MTDTAHDECTRRQTQTSSGNARIEVRASLDGVAAAWDDLVASAPRPSPFLRSWWLEGVASARPQFVLVLDGDELLGGLPLEEDRRAGVARLRFIGSEFAADHLDVVAARTHTEAVRDALATWLRRPGRRIVELHGVDDGSLVGDLPAPPVRKSFRDVALWTPLASTFEEYWSSRPSTLRNTVRRASKRLEGEGVRYERLAPERADVALAGFVALHQGRWDGASSLSPLLERFERAGRVGLQRGELVAHRLAHDDEAVAIELWLELGGIASFYQSGRSLDHRWRGAGSVLKARVFEDACARGMREMDLLRGDDAYKRDWTDGQRVLFTVTSAKGITARAARAALDAARGVRRHLQGRPDDAG